jgi:enterochelin esterase-like enzyme
MTIAGELITETFEHDGGREVTVYVPPDPADAVVFAGDGQLISQWGGVLEAANLRSTMIVGVHRLADERLRLREYSPGFDPERFAAHERFFVEDVRRWVRTRFGVGLPAGRTAVFGVSASGELALAVGLRHPDVYGAIFCASPGGGYRPPDVMPSSIPRTYLVAGTLEPFFLDNAARWAAALRDAGAAARPLLSFRLRHSRYWGHDPGGGVRPRRGADRLRALVGRGPTGGGGPPSWPLA